MQNLFSFSERQLSIIEGSLLGDGSITKPKYGNSSFSKPQSRAHRAYLEWHFKELGLLSSSLKDCDNWADGKLYYRTNFHTKTHPHFSSLRKKWYPCNKKVIPSDLKLTPLSVAVWFFDDGSNSLKSRTCRFATYCFQKHECDFLKDQLETRFGIISCISKDNVIIIRSESYKTLVDLVKPFMLWDCFEHKVRYRDAEFQTTTDEEALKMFALYEAGKSLTEVSGLVGKSKSVTSAVLRGTRMAHLGLSKAISGVPLTSKSGVRGISWDRERAKWLVHDRHGKYLGRFASLYEAKEKLLVNTN
jgi:hypothetical protein